MTSLAPHPKSIQTEPGHKVADRTTLRTYRVVCRLLCRRLAVGTCGKQREMPWPRPKVCSMGRVTAWAGATPSGTTLRGPDSVQTRLCFLGSLPPTKTVECRANARTKGK